MAVTGADFLLKALMLQSIVGVFIAEKPLAVFWSLTPSKGSLKTFFPDVCELPALENCHNVAQLVPQVFVT